MSEITIILSATGIVEQNGTITMITKQLLDSMVPQSKRNQAVPMGVEHDPFCAPIGKVQEIREVEPRGDGYVAIAVIYIEDIPSERFYADSGVELVRLDFEEDRRPFVNTQFEELEDAKDTLSVDQANFDDLSNFIAFENEVRSFDNDTVHTKTIMRHSFDPEPLMQYVISNPVIQHAVAFVTWQGIRYLQYKTDDAFKKNVDKLFDSLVIRIKRIFRCIATANPKAVRRL